MDWIVRASLPTEQQLEGDTRSGEDFIKVEEIYPVYLFMRKFQWREGLNKFMIMKERKERSGLKSLNGGERECI